MNSSALSTVPDEGAEVKKTIPPVVRSNSSAISLPTSAHTLNGQLFDPREETWVWRDAVARACVNFGSLKPLLSCEMLHSLKLVMLWLVENRATGSVDKTFLQLRRFFRFLRGARHGPVKEISQSDLLNYRASLPVHRHANMVGTVRAALRRWYSMGLPGISPDAMAFLKSVRIKTAVTGRAVRMHDPKMGPFTSIEFDGLISNLNQSVASGLIDGHHAALTHILIGLGIRTAQCALLKVCDIRRESHDGRLRYILCVPQVKQRHREQRTEFRERVLPEALGKIVYEQAQDVRAHFDDVLDDPGSAPLLPARQSGAALVPGYEYHSLTLALRQGLQHALTRLKVYSERTGERLHITPIRFRRTFATRAAAAGWSPLVIAEALGHCDTNNVVVYVEATPDIAARIDRALATEMAPLAQAFAGTLITDESEAIRGCDPASRIFDARIDRSGKPLGSCGQFSFCGFNAPLACYTCQHFQPWLDAPHEAVRDYLLDRRAQLLGTVTEQISQINDRCILAVEQVIQLCAQAKTQRSQIHG